MTQQNLVDEHQSSPEDIDDASNINDPESRIEFLERNLRYIQQQHETTLIDLHNEINRLQQENRDLHYQLNNTYPLKEKNNPEESINEKKIDELEKQLIKSEEKNIYLINQIDELNQILSSKSEESDTNNLNTDNNYQYLLTTSYEKQQEILQEIAKLRTVLLEILNTERLSLASKILLRDCLTPINISETSLSKTTTTPIDMLFINEKQQQQKFSGSQSITGKTSSCRQSNDQQRVHLPPIIQGNHSPLLQHQTDVNGFFNQSLSPTNHFQHQCLIKFGETPIARRERRTHELQKNRLMKTFFH